METSCQSIRERLVEYADRELAAAAHDAVESHLRSCPACTAEYEELLKLRVLAREIPGLASDSLDRQAIVRAARQRASRRPRLLLGRFHPSDLVTAMALGVAVLLAVLLRTEHRAASPRSFDVLTVAEVEARRAGAPLARTEIHMNSIDGRGPVRSREDVR